MKKVLFLLFSVCACFFQAHALCSSDCTADEYSSNDYTGTWGRLKLDGNQLCDQNGNAIQLKGWSSFGWQNNWGDCHSDNALKQMKMWGANIYRGAMYVEEGGYNSNPSGYTQTTKDLIDKTAELNMYYLCDWHVLTPGDPTNSAYSQAQTYFNEITTYVKSKGYTHVLYEICNEPNGVDWSTIKTYANTVLPTIQSNDPGAVVVVGTPQWDQQPDKAAADPITSYSNLHIMYAFHFYSCSHSQFLSTLDNVSTAIPVFISEWGIANFDGGEGTRTVDASCISAAKSLIQTYANGGNNGGQVMSWCSWSFGEKNEQASAVTSCSTLEPSITGAEVIKLMGGDGSVILPVTACYEGTCQKIPGIIDLGKYDNNPDADLDAIGGGEMVTYHEENTVADEVNSRSDCNGAYMWAGDDYNFRLNECVDASACYGITDNEGWHNLGYIEPGEWELFTVEVAEPGYYSIEALGNKSTKQNFTISSYTHSCNLTYDLDTKEEITAGIYFVSDASTLPSNGADWKNWAWYTPVQDLGRNSSTKVNSGVLFKEAGTHTIKVSWLAGSSETEKVEGDMGPLRFTKYADYTGAGYVSVEEAKVDNSSFIISPNPTIGSFKVSLLNADNADVMIYNQLGQAVYSASISNGSEINAGLATGTYFVAVKTVNSYEVSKLIVK